MKEVSEGYGVLVTVNGSELACGFSGFPLVFQFATHASRHKKHLQYSKCRVVKLRVTAEVIEPTKE